MTCLSGERISTGKTEERRLFSICGIDYKNKKKNGTGKRGEIRWIYQWPYDAVLADCIKRKELVNHLKTTEGENFGNGLTPLNDELGISR